MTLVFLLTILCIDCVIAFVVAPASQCAAAQCQDASMRGAPAPHQQSRHSVRRVFSRRATSDIASVRAALPGFAYVCISGCPRTCVPRVQPERNTSSAACSPTECKRASQVSKPVCPLLEYPCSNCQCRVHLAGSIFSMSMFDIALSSNERVPTFRLCPQCHRALLQTVCEAGIDASRQV